MCSNERWQPIDGWPYEVSDLGRVRRAAPGPRTRVGRVKKLHTRKDRYVSVHLYDGGRHTHVLVHRVVAAAFCSKPEGATQVNHINEVCSDNRASNLEWVTPAQNINHCYSCLQLRKENRKLKKELDRRPPV